MWCLFSPSWVHTCSDVDVLLYWHLVGSAREMGKWTEQAARIHTLTPPNTVAIFFSWFFEIPPGD